jgi:4a-hydroxytetrahydrobiopterin dehydratase
MTNLTAERCEACRKDSPRVTAEEQAELLPLIPEWQLTEENGIPRLERLFRFKSYPETLAFVQQVGELAEQEGHHPRLIVDWGKVTVLWWTHKIKWLHRNDFIMAAKTDEVLAQD